MSFRGQGGKAGCWTASVSNAAFGVLAETLKRHAGLVISPEQEYLLEARLSPVACKHALTDLEALAEVLANRHSERVIQDVIDAMMINETLFFRDGAPFDDLRRRVLPRLLQARPANAALRLWSAAASTGQEPYSMAMILTDHEPSLPEGRAEIVATDIAGAALGRARRGLFTQFEVERGLPAPALARHFRREADGWSVSQRLRQLVTFRRWNLLSDLRPLGQFDVVFCRNVLIYFDEATKAGVLEAIARQMAPDGVLYLGGSETVVGLTEQFVPVVDQVGAFVRADGARWV
jgi:chemotaxis protein methyltransferase CheR